MKELVLEYSDCIAVNGLQPVVVKVAKFDIELSLGAQLLRATLPKLSPGETHKEHYHIYKSERLGHLRTPTDEQKSESATPTHIVGKKDDHNGHWICDVRALNM